MVNEELTVHPVLFFEDGSPLNLEPRSMGPLGSIEIQINDLMKQLGYEPGRFGGAEFHYYREHNGALGVETEVLMAANSLAYSVQTFPRAHRRSNTQHAVFWLPTSDSEIFFAVHNGSDLPIVVHPELRIRGRNYSLDNLELPPRGFAKARLPENLPANLMTASLSKFMGDIGSVTLRHDGPAGALFATGWLDDKRVGFSTMMTFTDPAVANGQELFGAQLLSGMQADLPSPGLQTSFASKVIIKNISDIPVAANAELVYTEGSTVGTAGISLATLPPGAIRSIDLDLLKRGGRLPHSVSSASIRVRHTGPGGALMGRTIGVSEDLQLAVYGALEDHTAWSRSEIHWSLQGERNSLITVANFESEPQTVVVELAAGDSTVRLPTLDLQPGQSREVNLRKLVQSVVELQSLQGLSGGFRVFPETGSEAALIVKEQVFDPEHDVALPFYGGTDFVTSVWISVLSSLFLNSPGSTGSAQPVVEWNYGGPSCEGNFSSSYPAVADITSYGICPATITGQRQGSYQMELEGQWPSDDFGALMAMQASTPGSVECEIGVEVVDIVGTGSDRTARVQIRNTNCATSGSPSLSSVRVSFSFTEVTGLTPSWPSTNTVTINSVPSEGNTSAWHSLDFNTSGSGSLKVRALIDKCNGATCSSVKVSLMPSNKTSAIAYIP